MCGLHYTLRPVQGRYVKRYRSIGWGAKNMVILGIDPGIAIVGWGVVDFTGNKFRTIAYGAVTTPAIRR